MPTGWVEGRVIVSYQGHTYQTQLKSPWGMYFRSEIEARAAAVHSAAEEKILGFKGFEFRPWMAKLDSRLVQ